MDQKQKYTNHKLTNNFGVFPKFCSMKHQLVLISAINPFSMVQWTTLINTSVVTNTTLYLCSDKNFCVVMAMM